MPELTVRHESWPLAGKFSISRGSKTSAEVVVATVRDGDAAGHGECVPYARYGETVESVVAVLESLRPTVADRVDRTALQQALPAGAARNALDCALWDLEAKQRGEPVWRLAGLDEPGPAITAYTLSLDAPEAMGRAARAESHRPLLKIKLAGDGDRERIAAVRENAPDARLIVDANEGWQAEQTESLALALRDLGVELIEQPLPASHDAALSNIRHAVPFCADESCHDRTDLARLADRYDCINIKLDKTGGLTEALALKREAESLGLRIMVGCMVATSLSMAPAVLLAQGADYIDLDGPLLLARDRDNGLRYEGSRLYPSSVALWG